MLWNVHIRLSNNILMILMVIIYVRVSMVAVHILHSSLYLQCDNVSVYVRACMQQRDDCQRRLCAVHLLLIMYCIVV